MKPPNNYVQPYVLQITLFFLFQVLTLKDEIELLKTERDKVNSSMKDIIHGAEGYKVGQTQQ